MNQEAKFLEKQCWHCPTVTDEHFCRSCERIQEIDPADNYYTFFKLPIKFHLDLDKLEKQFYELNRRFHPDFFSQATELERRYSTERTSMLNDAYRTLKDPIKRANYLLTLKGLKTEQKGKTPPDLLAEIFELNEQIEELRYAKKAKDSEQINVLKAQVLETEEMLKGRSKELNNHLNKALLEWDNLSDISSQGGQKLLNQASETLSQMKYINNLLDDIEEEFDE